MFKNFFPKKRVEAVTELTPALLSEWGISALLLDVDCSLKRYSETDVSPAVRGWLDTLRTAGIGLCLLSNGRPERIALFADRVGLPFVAMAMKPSARGCLRAMTKHRFDPKSTAMVGDQIFADIWAGNRAGILTVLVTPIHPEEEPWFTRLKRPWERLVIRAVPRRF